MKTLRLSFLAGLGFIAAVAAVSCRKAPAPPPPAEPPPPAQPAAAPPSAFRPAAPSEASSPSDEGALDAAAETGGEGALQFARELARILAHYPELRAQHARVEEALAAQSMAVAGFLPSLRLQMGWERTDRPVGVFMNKLEQRSFQSRDFEVERLNHPAARSDFRGALRLEFPLFDAFQTIAATRTAGYALKSARARERHGRAEAALLAVESWLQAGRADRVETMVRESLARARRDLAEAESLRAQGLVLGADYYSARVAAAAMEQRLHEAVAARAAARAVFNVLRGESPEAAFALPPSPATVPFDPRPVKEWLEDAARNRADLRAARSAVDAQRSEVGRMKARVLPDLSLFAEGADHTRAFEQHGSDYTVGAQVRMDLFDPAHGGRVRAAAARLKQAEEAEAALRDAIATSIVQAAAHAEAARRNFALLETAARDGAEATRLARGLARDGRKSVADLLAARSAQLEVEWARAEARAEAVAARARLFFLAGALEGARLEEMALLLDPAGDRRPQTRSPDSKGGP